MEAGFEFQVIAPHVEERFDVDLTVSELTAFNAIRKAMSVARARPRDVVLAADTLVAIDGEILGKPRNIDHAVAMLRRLSGRSHEVCSAVFICQLDRAKSTTFHEVSEVQFRGLNHQAVRDYIDKVNPLDKAGAYAAQGFGSELSNGSTVLLPTLSVCRWKKQFPRSRNLESNRNNVGPARPLTSPN